jgi:hypothetical protein
MRIELMPGMTNVVRFPLERRVEPSLDLLWEIAPDRREVELVAESFDLDHRLGGTRHEADRAMAEHILNNVPPEPGPRRRLALDVLLRPLIGQAVDACRRAHRAGEIFVELFFCAGVALFGFEGDAIELLVYRGTPVAERGFCRGSAAGVMEAA